MLHCLGVPLLATVLPMVSLFGDSHLVHIVMVAMAVPVTLWVVFTELSKGKSEVFIGVALTGLVLMVLAVTLFEDYETPLTVAGGLLLGSAHLWRWFQHQPQVVNSDG